MLPSPSQRHESHYRKRGKSLFSLRTMALLAAITCTLFAFHYLLNRVVDGPVVVHMTMHIIIMSLIAPVSAWFLRPDLVGYKYFYQLSKLRFATLIQLLVFFFWHSPYFMQASMQSTLVEFATHVSLLLAAVWFWLAIFANTRERPWVTIPVLLLSGKLFCLVGTLYVFAPRLLYAEMIVAVTEMVSLGDQQLAGLIMLSVCPVTYIGASIVIAARWFYQLTEKYSNDSATPSRQQAVAIS